MNELLVSNTISLSEAQISDMQAIQRYLAEADIKSGSVRTYKSGVRRLYEWMICNNKLLHQMNRTDVILFKKKLVEADLSHKSKTAYFQGVISFLKWYGVAISGKDIVSGISGFDNITDFQKDAITKEEFKKLLNVCSKSDNYVSKRNFAIIWLLGTTGMRGSLSVRNLKWKDIIRRECVDEHDKVHLRDFIRYQKKGKAIKEDFVPINDDTYIKLMEWHRAVERYFGYVDDNWNIFYSFYPVRYRNSEKMTEPVPLSDSGFRDIVRSLMKEAGIWSKTKSMHSIRHFFATTILRQTNGNKELVRSLMGHSSTVVTDTYTKQADRFLISNKIQDISFV